MIRPNAYLLALLFGLLRNCVIQAAPLAIRPNVTNLTPVQRTNFVRCVVWMKTHPSAYDATKPSALNAYDWLVKLHNEGFLTHLTGGSGIHMAPSFFPWHREFLRSFEREIQRAALDLGFYISFSGILTFKSAQDLRDVAAFVPLDRLLIETDSPYLAPVPYRGKTNNPSYVPYVARQLADLRKIPVEDVARLTSANFERLFPAVQP